MPGPRVRKPIQLIVFKPRFGNFSVAGAVGSTSLGLNYSPDVLGGSGAAWYMNLGVGVPVGRKIDLAAHVARRDIEKEASYGQPDYRDWNLGATVNLAGFDPTVASTATDIAGNPDGADDMVPFTLSRSFQPGITMQGAQQ